MRGQELAHYLRQKGDGSGRPLRPIQEQVFDWLGENWDSGEHLVLDLSVAAGKSFIGRALQALTDAPIITNKNTLVDQYKSDYSEINAYKGKMLYHCKTKAVPCAVAVERYQTSYCATCPLRQSRDDASAGRPTVFNPISYWYFIRDNPHVDRKLVIVDEAHALISQMRNLSNVSMKLKPIDLKFFEDLGADLSKPSIIEVLEWYYFKRELLDSGIKANPNVSTKIKLEETIAKLEVTFNCLLEEGHLYSVSVENNVLNIRSILLPRWLIKRYFPGRVVLMSGSLYKPDLKEFFENEPYKKLVLDSPIPVKNRQVLYSPFPFKMTPTEVNYAEVARLIEQDINLYAKGGNTIVHVTYEMSEKLEEHWTNPFIISHNNKNKAEKLQMFMKKGGVFIAAGCEEGLDLKDELCQLNIIAKIRWPYLGDPWVAKKRAFYGGELWYLCEALKFVIQAAGRSTRSATDFSTIIVKDLSFPYLISKARTYQQLQGYFDKSIRWRPSLKTREVISGSRFAY
jgi:Rad3-related DNA helicase